MVKALYTRQTRDIC